MIDNYKELIEVKKELKNRIHETEKHYLRKHEQIPYLLDITKIYKGTKNEKNKKHIHSLIIQSIIQYIEEQQIFNKYNKEYASFFIPLALTLISAFIVKKI